MTSIAKLKDRARKHEQREDWKAAIEAYQKVLEAEEGQDELELELGLYNRVGDLYLRLGQTDQAVSYYETAADKYAEAGFYNNAIALCNKALRHRPERPQTYLKLSRLCIEQGFIPDARRWILDYAERQVRIGKVEDALSGLEDFADTTGDPDVRELLARHLANQDRPDDAVAQLRLAYEIFVEQGNHEAAERVAGRVHELDASVELGDERPEDSDFASGAVIRPGAEPADPWQQGGEREAEEAPAGGAEGDEGKEGDGLAGLETHRHEDAGSAGGARSIGGLETFAAEEDPDEEVLDAPGEGVQPSPGAGLEPEPDEGGAEPLPFLETGYEEEPEEEPEPLPLLEGSGTASAEDEVDADYDVEVREKPGEKEAGKAEKSGSVGAADGFGDLDAPGQPRGDIGEGSDDPMAAAKKYGIEPIDLDSTELSFGPSDMTGEPAEVVEDLDIEAVLTRARELVSRALTGEALRELRLLSGAEAPPEAFRQALAVANEIVRHEANDVPALQARVEFASAAEDDELLIGAYLDLGDALARLGSETKAKAMYERVLDLDPENEAARDALGSATEASEETIDLDAILREMEPEGTPSGEPNDPAFASMLSQLKSRVSEHGEADDAGDHYDLGLAFKEMGLIDEAIAEFQTALKAGEERLKIYEELGQCFVLKRQFTVALKVFKRALQMPAEDEVELLGVYYLLGQCHEELGQRAEAREAYQKILSIDDSFADVPARVARL